MSPGAYGYMGAARQAEMDTEAYRARILAQCITNSPGAIIRVPSREAIWDAKAQQDHLIDAARASLEAARARDYVNRSIQNFAERVAPPTPSRTHTRVDDTLVAWIAAPVWAMLWVLTFGHYGKPLWRVA